MRPVGDEVLGLSTMAVITYGLVPGRLEQGTDDLDLLNRQGEWGRGGDGGVLCGSGGGTTV